MMMVYKPFFFFSYLLFLMVGRRTSSSHAARPIVIVGEEAHRHIDAHRFDDVLVVYVEVLESVTARVVIALTIIIWLFNSHVF